MAQRRILGILFLILLVAGIGYVFNRAQVDPVNARTMRVARVLWGMDAHDAELFRINDVARASDTLRVMGRVHVRTGQGVAPIEGTILGFTVNHDAQAFAVVDQAVDEHPAPVVLTFSTERIDPMRPVVADVVGSLAAQIQPESIENPGEPADQPDAPAPADDPVPTDDPEPAETDAPASQRPALLSVLEKVFAPDAADAPDAEPAAEQAVIVDPEAAGRVELGPIVIDAIAADPEYDTLYALTRRTINGAMAGHLRTINIGRDGTLELALVGPINRIDRVAVRTGRGLSFGAGGMVVVATEDGRLLVVDPFSGQSINPLPGWELTPGPAAEIGAIAWLPSTHQPVVFDRAADRLLIGGNAQTEPTQFDLSESGITDCVGLALGDAYISNSVTER